MKVGFSCAQGRSKKITTIYLAGLVLQFLQNQMKPDEDVRQFKFIGNLNLYRLTFLPNQMRTDGDVLAIQILTFQRPKKNSDWCFAPTLIFFCTAHITNSLQADLEFQFSKSSSFYPKNIFLNAKISQKWEGNYAFGKYHNSKVTSWSNFCQVLNRIIQLIEISKGASPDDIWAQDEEL